MTKNNNISKWDYISNHPFYSGLILLIFTGIGSVFSDNFRALIKTVSSHVWEFTVYIWNWTLSTHAVFGWILIVLGILSLIAIRLLARLVKIELVKNLEPDFIKYNHEIFYYIDWFWEWKKDYRSGKYYPNNLSCFCPECKSQLKTDIHSYKKVECINDNCDWEWHWAGRHKSPALHEIEEKLKTEIMRKITTEEYKQTVNTK